MSVRPLTNEGRRLCRQLNSRCHGGRIRATKFCERNLGTRHNRRGNAHPARPKVGQGVDYGRSRRTLGRRPEYAQPQPRSHRRSSDSGAIILIARPTFERPPDRQAAAENRRGSGRSYRRLAPAAASPAVRSKVGLAMRIMAPKSELLR